MYANDLITMPMHISTGSVGKNKFLGQPFEILDTY